MKEVVGLNIYKIEDPTGQTLEAHAARIRYYAGKEANFTEEVRLTFLANSGAFEVQELLQLKFSKGQYYVKVWWRGFRPI